MAMEELVLQGQTKSVTRTVMTSYIVRSWMYITGLSQVYQNASMMVLRKEQHERT